MRKNRYKNIFMFSSLQFCGNTEEYFSHHCKKLVAFIIMPRVKNKGNLLRIYNNGRLIEEKKVWLSGNILLYYMLWYFFYLFFILKYFSRKEKFIVYSGHPISFFAMCIQKIFRNIVYVYFVGDYFPATNFVLGLYEKVKKHYHDNITYSSYLSDRINKQMNGRVIKSWNRKTVMWGVKPKRIRRSYPKDICSILFIGLIKDSQGLEFLLRFLKNHKTYRLNIVGVCNDNLFKRYHQTIEEYSIRSRVFFPNKFFTDSEIDELSKECHIGVALYDTNNYSATYYTDPGKIKAYAELGLPVVMTNTSAIAEYIRKFKAGEVIELSEKSLEKALLDIKDKYALYKKRVDDFNRFFFYEKYYKQAFKFLESI